MPKVAKVDFMPCPENGCDGALVKRHTKDGKPYWCCTESNCNATHGAHGDGTPLGVPGDSYTRFVRKVAHEVFDKLWNTAPRDEQQDARLAAYKWLADRLGIDRDDAHIGKFDVEACDRVIELVGSKGWPYLRRWMAKRQKRRARRSKRMYSYVASNSQGFDRRRFGKD